MKNIETALNKQFTKEELEAESFLDWSNESLGKQVRISAEQIKGYDKDGRKGIMGTAAGLVLVALCRDGDAESATLTLAGHTDKGEPTGDWEVTVKRIKKP